MKPPQVGDVAGASRARRFSVQSLETLATGAAFSVLHVLGLVGTLPLPALLLMLMLALMIARLVSAHVGRSPAQHHLRMAVQMLTTSVIIYAIGWGPPLA